MVDTVVSRKTWQGYIITTVTLHISYMLSIIYVVVPVVAYIELIVLTPKDIIIASLCFISLFVNPNHSNTRWGLTLALSGCETPDFFYLFIFYLNF